MELFGFRVSIRSDGEELEEHSVEVSPDGKKATCWVPSQSGKEFAVKYEVGESSAIKGKAKALDVYVDGRKMRKLIMLPRETHYTVDGVRTSDNVMRRFMFADIRTTDEDSPFGDIHANPDEIGTIRLEIFLSDIWRRSDSSSRNYRIQDHPPAVISERTKKVAEHCVSLGDEQPCRARKSYTMDFDPQKPDLLFEFRYRSKAMLWALGIIPPLKREAPQIADVEDEDILPPPKRQKGEHDKGLTWSLQVGLVRLRRGMGEIEGENLAGPSGVKKEVIKREPVDIIGLTWVFNMVPS